MEVDILTAISQVGFPIAVATYALVRLDTTVRENTKVMIQISERLKIVEKEGDK